MKVKKYIHIDFDQLEVLKQFKNSAQWTTKRKNT